MADTCPVVRIVTPAGIVEINESDYNPKIHQLESEPQKTLPLEAKPAETANVDGAQNTGAWK